MESSIDKSHWSLPYIDSEYNDPNLKAQVDTLIKEELSQVEFKAEEYLKKANIPDPPSLDLSGTCFLSNEWERVSTGQALKALDESHYNISSPRDSSSSPSLQDWKKALDNTRTQLQHQTTKMVNLELLKRFGGNAWKLHTQDLHAQKRVLESQLDKSKKEMENVNRKRKADQTSAGVSLATLEREWLDLVNKNSQIQTAATLLQLQIKRLKAQALNRGFHLASDETVDKVNDLSSSISSASSASSSAPSTLSTSSTPSPSTSEVECVD